MNLLFIISGIIVFFYSFAFQEGEFKNKIFQYGCMGCGGALIIAVFGYSPVDWYAYMFYMAFPSFTLLYLLITDK